MIRQIARTLLPSVALYTTAACLSPVLTVRAEDETSTTSEAPQVAARSGYIVASS